MLLLGIALSGQKEKKDEILDGAVKKYLKKRRVKKVYHYQAAKFADLCESSKESLSTDSVTEYNSESLEKSHQYKTYLVFIQFL